MLSAICEQKLVKVVAVFVAISVLSQLISPTVAWALTTGPSQPEMDSFLPVGTTEMVDLFTGDFKYNIPLMNVPGPDGGYPINLAYEAGITMEQEASWVGLGWNLNPGVVKRSMRGIPDDFSSDDKVSKEKNMRPQRRVALNLEVGAINIEAMGKDINKGAPSGNSSIYYDSYKGFGYNTSSGFSATIASFKGVSLGVGLGYRYDSNDGVDVHPSASVSLYGFQLLTVGATMHSRQGLRDVYVSNNFYKHSFAGASYVPTNDMPMGGSQLSFEAKSGKVAVGITGDIIDSDITYSESKLKQTSKDFPAYGYLYAENRVNTATNPSLADFNREKDGPVTRVSKSLPIPQATYDVFHLSAQDLNMNFRCYRSDVGVFSDPLIEGGMRSGLGDGAEFNTSSFSAEFKAGLNEKFLETTTYSGPWRDQRANLEYLKWRTKATNSLAEPAYFKSMDEFTPYKSADLTSMYYDDEPMHVKIGETFHAASKSRRPVVLSSLQNNHSNQTISKAYSPKRDIRTNSIRYLTRAQLKNMPDKWIDVYNADGSTTYEEKFVDFPAHIGEISVVNASGKRYNYGLPAYNHKHREVSFSLENSNKEAKLVTYDPGNDNSTSNDQGFAQLFLASEVPDYAHSFLLTSILSHDYIDIGEDGPDEKDMGSYVKFNYSRAATNFKWRMPYGSNEANNSVGFYSDPEDDMGSYSYGEKDIFYVQEIETKTHIARFTVSNRHDGIGTAGENGGVGSEKLRQLDKIELFSKKDVSFTNPIKTIEFSYDYSLCPGIPNSDNAGGKLTLKSLTISYGQNNKGQLSPYKFTYGNNPSYSELLADRWGNYQNRTGFGPIQEFTYTNQTLDEPTRSANASSWNITEIALPSGSTIKVEYESDDYGYVQNKRAMEMFQVVGTGNTSGKTVDGRMGKNDRRVYFKLNKPIKKVQTLPASAINDLKDHLVGIEYIYFKTWQKLKKYHNSDLWAYDYVEGYAKPDINLITETGFGFDAAAEITIEGDQYYSEAYLKVKEVDVSDNSFANLGTTHPFRKAGWQYLRLKRSDLFSSRNILKGNLKSPLDLLIPLKVAQNLVKENQRLIRGYYNQAAIDNYCELIDFDTTINRPSIIRLNSSNNTKYGGGHRVQQLTLNDGWDHLNGWDDDDPNPANVNTTFSSYEYGQTYEYQLKDGKSSGVAAYEPLLGGEENPLRQPVWYGRDNILAKGNTLYVEEPYNENLFPSGNVGYSRVIVRPLQRTFDTGSGNDTILASHTGFEEHRYYTAKDYPVITNHTGIQDEGENNAITLPFIGSKSVANQGFTQGFSIELNNMHGKLKKVSQYAARATLVGEKPSDPETSTTYFYLTENGMYKQGVDNRLRNFVNVLSDNRTLAYKEMGKQVEMYTDELENFSSTLLAGESSNLMNLFIGSFPIPIPKDWESVDYAEHMFRSIATNKVITRNAILERIVHFNKGAEVTERNLLYDEYTGQPLMTARENSFDKDVTTYNYAAHWGYEGMGPASKNIGVIVDEGLLDPGIDATTILYPGDELMDGAGNKFWVETVSANAVSLKDESNAVAALGQTPLMVLRSGRRNMIEVPMGQIVSIDNPVEGRSIPVFEKMSEDGNGVPNPVPFMGDRDYEDCYGTDFFFINCLHLKAGTNEQVLTLFINKGGTPVPVAIGNFSCQVDIIFPSAASSFDMATDFGIQLGGCPGYANTGECLNCIITMDVAGVVTLTDGVNTIQSTSVNFSGDCGLECTPGVIQTYANTFDDAWTYDWIDADVSNTYVDATKALANPYRYGQKGTWRLEKSFIMDKLRNQKDPATDIAVDGTIDGFIEYDWWDPAPTANKKWTLASQVKQYSPYGYALESEDIQQRPSSAIYGYDHTLPVSVASNAGYYELVNENFEEYSSSTYDGNTGHIHFTSGTTSISTVEAHTGEQSLLVSAGVHPTYATTVDNFNVGPLFTPGQSKDYVVSCWVKATDFLTDAPKVNITDGTTTLFSFETSPYQSPIEGWKRIEGIFTTPSSGSLHVELEVENATAYFDDFRIRPLLSSANSYVYDPVTLWLTAELDDNNFATYYNYDEEGELVQTKKETFNGIVTLVSGRKNTRQTP